MRHTLSGLLAILSLSIPAAAQQRTYPMTPADLCGSSQTCAAVVDRWNDAGWASLVDESFHSGALPMGMVRWYSSEGSYTLKSDPACPNPNAALHKSCGVTDEFSNVLLNFAMGSNQARYQRLHRFSELLRHPSSNNLQCWKFKIDGVQNYTSYSQVCVEADSAADASARILGAYGIACAKQRAGTWPNNGTDYCADYAKQGNAIFGIGTSSHGEVKLLANGEYYLANGYNNQAGAPVANESFRPDYYELQFLMDFARYSNDNARIQGVKDMLAHYFRAAGLNRIHGGKTGHFDANATNYSCDSLCSPAYMDNIDTWRAVPALSGLLNVHPAQVPPTLKSGIYDYWWNNFSGGHPTLFGPTQELAFEIHASLQNPAVKQTESSYKTLSMWIPLAAARNATSYLTGAISQLVNVKYDGAHERFHGSAYYGGYFSQFAQRAIGSATGMIDPAFWAPNLLQNGDFVNGTNGWWVSSGNGASASISVTGANRELRVAIAAGGTYPWDVFAGQGGIQLVQGAAYQLKFDARAASSRALAFRVVKTSGDWREYTNQTVNLTPAGQTFTNSFTVNDTVSPGVNFEFRLGGQGANDVWVDNVRLVRTN